MANNNNVDIGIRGLGSTVEPLYHGTLRDSRPHA